MSNSDVILSQIRQRLEILYQMVDELEAGGGGGGGGGTTNYNNLTNKPAIEGQQLVGNKTASDLGLATTSELNGKVDKVAGSSLMTSAQATKLEGIEAGAEVNVQADWNQANSSSDDYIKNKPTLGAAAERGVDTVPTDDSTNLITSGAVFDAIQGGGGGGGTDLTPTYVGAKAETFPEEYMGILEKHLPFTDTTSFGPSSGAFGPWTFYSESYSVYVYISVSVQNDIPYGALIFKMATINKVNRTWTEQTNAKPRYLITKDILNKSVWSSVTENISSTNANLNDYSAGRYYSSVDPTNFVNCPTTDRFFLTAEENTSSGSNYRVKQTLTTLSATNPPTVYIRTYINGTWGSWYKFEGTVVS